MNNDCVNQDAFTDKFFQKSELLPAIIQEYGTNEVLMLAYMNRESMKCYTDVEIVPANEDLTNDAV